LDEALEKDAVCHRFCVIYTASTLTKEAVEGFGDLKIAGQ